MVEHLKKGNITYTRHCFEAIIGGVHLIITGFVSIIHGLFPFLFEKYVAKTLISYYWRHFHNHPNHDIQEIIRHEREIAQRKQELLFNVDNVIDFEEQAIIYAEYEKMMKDHTGNIKLN